MSVDRERDAALLIVNEEMSGAAGGAFFSTLVRHLAQALDVRYALVSERATPRRLRTLAVWGGAPRPPFEYDLEGTPCEITLRRGRAFYPDRLQQRFPRDVGLLSWEAESYYGVGLRDASGEVVGTLCILDDESLVDGDRLHSVMEAFEALAIAGLKHRDESPSRVGDPDLDLRTPGGEGRILALDDDPGTREVLERMLTRLGYDCTVVCDGREAIDAWETARREGKPYAAVVVDLTIPGGLGGHDVVERLRARNPDLRAIASSVYSNDPILADSRHHGFVGVLEKPYSVERLAEVFRQALAVRAVPSLR